MTLPVTPVTTRAGKGSALSHTEVDANFTILETSISANTTAINANAADITAAEADIAALQATTYTGGWEDYNDSGAAYPKALTVAGTKYLVENDGAGPYSSSMYAIPGRGPIWDVTADEFHWGSSGAELLLGDTVDLRMDMDFDAGGANHVFSVFLRMGVGSPSQFDLPVWSGEFRYAGVHNRILQALIYMGSSDIRDFPAELYVSSDSTGDEFTLNGVVARYNLRTPSTT